jgi:hypothetical protein
MGKSGKQFRERDQKRDEQRRKKIDARFSTEKPKDRKEKDKPRRAA